MKYILALLVSASAFAAKPTYDLNIKVKLQDNVITPRFIVKEQEAATMIRETGDKESFVDVVATERPDGIHMKFTVGSIIDGERVVHATPEMVVEEGTLAELNTTNEDEGNLSLSVIAKKVVEEEEADEL